MGNIDSTTNLDTDPIFDHEPTLDADPIYVRLIAQGIELVLEIQRDKTRALDATYLSELKKKGARVYKWTPHSHMRDFEVLEPYTSKEIRIARGQGIGIILVETLDIYLKIIYDKTTSNGINIVQNTQYHGKAAAKELLQATWTTDMNCSLSQRQEGNSIFANLWTKGMKNRRPSMCHSARAWKGTQHELI